LSADTNALPERGAGNAGKCKVADHPPVSHMVVKNYPVAVILLLPQGYRAQPGKMNCKLCRLCRSAVTQFVKDLDRGIDRIDVVVRSHVAVGIGRKATTAALS
jgi:hypothetical protein